MSHRDPSRSGPSMHQHSMQPPSPSIPIDPALSLSYPSYYQNYPQHLPQHLTLPPSYSSPSSQGSDTLGTPPTEHKLIYTSAANLNGKRPSSSLSNDDTRKRLRKEETSPMTDKEEVKVKSTRGSRACTVCRRLKMKCQGAESGGPCKRCQAGNHECIFEESNRGKRSSKKHELLTRSLKRMEKTLDTVLRSIGNPGIASGMVSRSPSPSANAQSATTSALLAASPSPPPSESPAFRDVPASSPKLHSLPDNALNPLGLLAEASLANRRSHVNPSPLMARSDKSDDKLKIGVASDNYFKPGPMTILPLRRLFIERQIQPEMLSFVSTEEVVALFNIFFDHIDMHCSLLERSFHTPSLVCSRSPFLLTTICSIASKFYTTKPELHPRLTELAKKLAFSVPAQGYKSVEIVQAYLLLSLWGFGAVERYEQDKTWFLLGMAIRMATDLNLHRKTAVTSQDTQEGKARDLEVHNREKTWILCFCLDRSFSAQMGKPHTIKEDAIIRGAGRWCQSPVAVWTDAALSAYCELHRVLSRCLDILYSGTDTSSGLQTHTDFMLVIKTFEAQVDGWRDLWIRPWQGQGEQEVAEYKQLIAQFYYHYAILVLNAFGLQNAMDRSSVDLGHFFARCHSSATACALLVRDSLGPSGFLKYSPDSHFVLTSYAVLSLLKLVRPELEPFFDNQQKTLSLVKDIADTLEKVAVNAQHAPALYSTFIRALVTAKMETIQNNNNNNGGLQAGMDANTNVNDTACQDPAAQLPSYQQVPSTNGYGQHLSSYLPESSYLLGGDFHFGESEMGPVADMSTFPPTMAEDPTNGMGGGGAAMSMDNILSSGFWDSVLVPGYNTMDGLSGGFLFGAGGSGLITPRMGMSPAQSGATTPAMPSMAGVMGNGINGGVGQQQSFSQMSYGEQIKREGMKVDS